MVPLGNSVSKLTIQYKRGLKQASLRLRIFQNPGSNIVGNLGHKVLETSFSAVWSFPVYYLESFTDEGFWIWVRVVLWPFLFVSLFSANPHPRRVTLQ